ncbi:hypothetical protein A4U53_038800 (plasmid) [Rhizobium ruizarguesonis]|uniref:Uncharacterized protein n=2 Tax=Rhizobium TaxID=379 RepID=A0A179BDH0_RHILE|nr:hypothetical protein [Rhizobium leguminosarum]OAP89064.1 hypothetical protein A4U53_33450 [Rhizobium leguminosarum]
MTRHILLAGSAGLIGRSVRLQLGERPDIDLISLVRNGSTAPGHPIDFEQLYVAPEATLMPVAPDGVNVAISCLGSTIRTTRSQPAMFNFLPLFIPVPKTADDSPFLQRRRCSAPVQ